MHLRNNLETGNSFDGVLQFCSIFLIKTHNSDNQSSPEFLNSVLHAIYLCPFLLFTEPMRTPKRLKIAETRSRLIAVDWESLGYNITRCHTFNVTICYHYMTANNRSKADCLDMDPKGESLKQLLLRFTIILLIYNKHDY